MRGRGCVAARRLGGLGVLRLVPVALRLDAARADPGAGSSRPGWSDIAALRRRCWRCGFVLGLAVRRAQLVPARAARCSGSRGRVRPGAGGTPGGAGPAAVSSGADRCDRYRHRAVPADACPSPATTADWTRSPAGDASSTAIVLVGCARGGGRSPSGSALRDPVAAVARRGAERQHRPPAARRHPRRPAPRRPPAALLRAAPRLDGACSARATSPSGPSRACSAWPCSRCVWIAGRPPRRPPGGVAPCWCWPLSPYAHPLRTETRMYSHGHGARRWPAGCWPTTRCAGPTLPRLAGLALLAGALLWTHYWAMWLLAAAAIGLLVHAGGPTAGRSGRRRPGHRAGAVGAGRRWACCFLPWLPSLLYQSAHTGTPVGRARCGPPRCWPSRSSTSAAGRRARRSCWRSCSCCWCCLGLFGRPLDAPATIELDLRTRPEARPLLVIIGFTMVVAIGGRYATGSASPPATPRCRAVRSCSPPALGLARFGGTDRRSASSRGGRPGARCRRRRAQRDHRPHPGPRGRPRPSRPNRPQAPWSSPAPTSSARPRPRAARRRATSSPTRFAPPQLVDWVDYTERLAARPTPSASRPRRCSGPVTATSGSSWSGTYKTHEGTCERVLNTMLQSPAVGHEPRGRPAASTTSSTRRCGACPATKAADRQAAAAGRAVTGPPSAAAARRGGG